MKKLGHEGRRLHALKVDVEGHEWGMLFDDVLNVTTDAGVKSEAVLPPTQLHVELH